MNHQPRHWGSRVGIALIVSGVLLLAVTTVGRVTGAGRYADSPLRSWERFDPALVARTPSLDALFRDAQSRAVRSFRELPPEETMRILYETVADRFTHGDSAHYTLLSNWLLWGLGHLDEKYSLIQEPDALLRLGHSVLCGDSSYVLIRLAGKAGLTARFVNLGGHVIMEAWYAGAWHAYDADMEVIPRDASGTVPSAHDLSLNTHLVRQAYAGLGNAGVVESFVSIYSSRGDNWATSPVAGGTTVPPLSPRLGKIEDAAQKLIFVLPFLMILCGAGILRASGSPCPESVKRSGSSRR